MQLNSQSIIEALKHVRYPGTGKDIVSIGILDGEIHIEGNKVSFSLLFDKQNDPFVKSIVKAAEQAILTYVGESVDVKGNVEVKYKASVAAVPEKALPDVKNIIAVFSGKGGVGKSTISSNLAVALAEKGYKVGLLDADIYGPSIPKMFRLEDKHPTVEEIDGKQYIIPLESFGVKVLSIGFFVEPDNALVWRGAMAGNALKQLILDARWGELDYFIIDLPPGTSDIHLTIVQTMGVTGALIVTTPQAVAIADARKGINMFTNDKIQVPILGLVENMAWFTPLELPDNKYYIFGKDGGKLLAEDFNIPLLAQIPLLQTVCESSDAGTPIALNENDLISGAFRELAENLAKSVEKRNDTLEKTRKVEIKK